MKSSPREGLAARRMAASALVALAACSSPTESTYPPITGAYGGQGAPGAPFNAPVQFDITSRSPDGTEAARNVQGTFIIATQVESQWAGEVRRYSFPTGDVTGEVTIDGAIRFTVTQAQWGDCASTDSVSYSGYSRSGGLSATGGGTVHCADGTILDIEESLHGRLPEPPLSPG